MPDHINGLAMTFHTPISVLTAAASNEGLAGWQAFVSSFRATLDDPTRGLPTVALIAGVFLVLWLNVRLARWIIRRAGA